jgi:hypothetical protein
MPQLLQLLPLLSRLLPGLQAGRKLSSAVPGFWVLVVAVVGRRSSPWTCGVRRLPGADIVEDLLAPVLVLIHHVF